VSYLFFTPLNSGGLNIEMSDYQKISDAVYGQLRHLAYKNWDCGCKRNAATAVMTRNYPRDDDSAVIPTHDREEEKTMTWLGVHMQMWHVCQKTCIETDGECGCERRNAAIAVMARNFPHRRR